MLKSHTAKTSLAQAVPPSWDSPPTALQLINGLHAGQAPAAAEQPSHQAEREGGAESRARGTVRLRNAQR